MTGFEFVYFYRSGGKDTAVRYWQTQLGFGLGKWASTIFYPMWSRISGYFITHFIVTILGLMVAFDLIDSFYLLIPFGAEFLLGSVAMLLPPKYLHLLVHLDYIPMIFTELDLCQYGIVSKDTPLPPKVEVSGKSFVFLLSSHLTK